jgi:hypothetical protein
MIGGHLFKHCQGISEDDREKLKVLKDLSKYSDGGGKRYWGEALQSLGIQETPSVGLVWNDTARARS